MSTPKQNFYPVRGRSDTGIIAPRLSIEELQGNAEQFTLFILSFLAIQDREGEIAPSPIPVPPSTGVAAAAFFNIAAIHGKPYARWAGDNETFKSDFDPSDTKDTNSAPSRFGGYCNHGSVLFPTWHRPYVMLIEQAIGDQATALAKAFDKSEGSTKWQDAAKQLRFPYWDWADPRVEKEGVPNIFCEDAISLKIPGNTDLVQVPNPLALYPINSIPSDFTDEADNQYVKSYFTKWKTTLRHPRSDGNAEKSRIEEMQKTVKRTARELCKKVSSLFTFGDNDDPARAWDEFSNHSPVSVSKSSAYRGSLESVHDTVHDIVGGLGHMGFPDYAGFDPIFFFHHCNVDRIYALWEYCYQRNDDSKGYWMGNGYKVTDKQGIAKFVPWIQPQGTYSEVYNAQLLPDTALAPFRTHSGEYWSSNEARFLDNNATYQKYYTYHALGSIKVEDDATDEQRAKARRALQKYYQYDPQEKKLPGGLFETVHIRLPQNYAVVEGHRQFVVSVELLEHAYNGPYSFKLFGKGNSGLEPLGTVSVFARPDHSPCAACAGNRANGSTVRGVVFLDENFVIGLIHNDQIKTRGTTDVALALKDMLHAELTSANGAKLGVVHSPEEGFDVQPSAPQTSEVIPPVGVMLLSTAAVRRNDMDDSPVHWADWRNHGEVFAGGHHAWKSPNQ